MKKIDIENLLSKMTLEEKASLCSAADAWHTKKIERLNLPSIMVPTVLTVFARKMTAQLISVSLTALKLYAFQLHLHLHAHSTENL